MVTYQSHLASLSVRSTKHKCTSFHYCQSTRWYSPVCLFFLLFPHISDRENYFVKELTVLPGRALCIIAEANIKKYHARGEEGADSVSDRIIWYCCICFPSRRFNSVASMKLHDLQKPSTKYIYGRSFCIHQVSESNNHDTCRKV